MPDFVIDQAYAAGWRLTRWAPEPVAQSLFRSIADRAWERRGTGVVQLERNLARVAPTADVEELKQMSREGMRTYLRYWCEAFRLPAMGPAEIRRRVDLPGFDLLVNSMSSGGAVAALPHMGNWDLAAAWVLTEHTATIDGRITTVAERVKPESLFQRFVAAREALGVEVLPTSGGDRPVLSTLTQRVAEGGLVALVADRDFSRSGVPVDFFGETAHFPSGPGAIAVDTGRPLHPVALWYRSDGSLTGQVHPAVSIPGSGSRAERIVAATQQLAGAFEADVRRHPSDWHMLQRLWDADRSVPR